MLPIHVGSDLRVEPAGTERQFTVSGFFTQEDVVALRTIPAAVAARVFLRILPFAMRPVTKRRRRLCQQVGHPKSRRASTYSAVPSPPRFTRSEDTDALAGSEVVSFDLDDAQVESFFCLRCGKTYAK